MFIVYIFDIPFDDTDDVTPILFEMFNTLDEVDSFLGNYLHLHKGSVSRVVISSLIDYQTFTYKEDEK